MINKLRLRLEFDKVQFYLIEENYAGTGFSTEGSTDSKQSMTIPGSSIPPKMEYVK